jgi:hypothetical protein
MAPIVGFDFDDCLTHAYSMLPIVLLLEHLLINELRMPGVSRATREAMLFARNKMYDTLASNEVRTKGYLIRPSFLNILPRLLRMRATGEIAKLFIYSNNTNSLLINTIDHILALTLQKMGMPVEQLVTEPFGSITRLQTLSPRVVRNSECRYIEPINGSFKEKTLDGILSCVGLQVPANEVWFFDDTTDHKSLMSSIKSNYIEVKKYDVQLKNSRLAEFIITSFPRDAFNPLTEMGRIFMKAYSILETNFIVVPPGEKYLLKENPRFNPKATDDDKKRAEGLRTSLNAVSPLSAGRAKAWTVVETNTDTNTLMKKLDALFNPAAAAAAPVYKESTLDLETATAYREPLVGGRQSFRRSPVSSRFRKKRLFTRRRK